MFNINNLNEKQLAAVRTTEGPVVVIAGAGTGKTRVLTSRISYLIQELGIAPFRILGFTFTNKAASEMKSRVSTTISGVNVSWIGTYHGVCLRILKEEIQFFDRAGTFVVIDDEDQKIIVNRIVRENKIMTSMKANKIVGSISKIKNLFLTKSDLYGSKNFSEMMKSIEIYSIDDLKAVRFIYEEYQEHLHRGNMVDYDDLILMTHKVLKESIPVREKWQKKFDYVMVDEFQDTNLVQFELLNFLIDPVKKNVFVVGDPDQTIYTWRGAYPDVFKDFISAYGDVKKIILDINYRSTKNILNGSNSLINKNLNRIEKNLITDNEEGNKVGVFHGDLQVDESEFVCEKIKELVKSGETNYGDIAILYRNNYLSRFIEEGLVQNSIPYKIFGGVKFYQRAEIKDLIAYLKLCADIKDELSMRRIINVPKRLVGPQTIEQIARHALENGMGFNQSFIKCSVDQNLGWSKQSTVKLANTLIRFHEESKNWKISETIENIIKAVEYDNHLKTLENYDNRIENIGELVNQIKKFEEKKPDAKIHDYLQEISLYTDPNDGVDGKVSTVSLMTIHTAKGTEYHTVFVVGVNEGIFPNSRITADISEERRIAYVAMTRARKNLFLTCSNDYSFIVNANLIPSRFLGEIEKDCTMSVNKVKVLNRINPINTKFSNLYSGPGVNLGDSVIHGVFGVGVVVRVSGQFADIQFEPPHGIKTLIKNHTSLKKINN